MMRQFTATQVHEYVQKAATPPLLLDVREPHEVAICAIAGSVNIPLGQISTAWETLDPNREIVLICHHGIRSMQAGLFLEQQGFEHLINLTGGINAWAQAVEPAMARY